MCFKFQKYKIKKSAKSLANFQDVFKIRPFFLWKPSRKLSRKTWGLIWNFFSLLNWRRFRGKIGLTESEWCFRSRILETYLWRYCISVAKRGTHIQNICSFDTGYVSFHWRIHIPHTRCHICREKCDISRWMCNCISKF